jgi:serine protease Do
VRDLLPQLRNGKVIRGRIGVSVTAVPREGYEDFGLKARSGAIVATVSPGGAAAKAGIEPGDVVVQYNGRPVASRDELVSRVVATKPGTSVPVKVMRNKQEKTLNVTVEELDLEAEQNGGRRTPSQGQQDPPEEHGATGFGLTLENVTPSMARRLQMPSGQSGAGSAQAIDRLAERRALRIAGDGARFDQIQIGGTIELRRPIARCAQDVGGETAVARSSLHQIEVLRASRGPQDFAHLLDLDGEELTEDRADVDAGKEIARAPGTSGRAGVVAEL